MNEMIGGIIKGSRYVRAYCHRCNEPIRVEYARDFQGKPLEIFCVECGERPHIGCSSPPSPLDNVDEYSSSWKLATGLD